MGTIQHSVFHSEILDKQMAISTYIPDTHDQYGKLPILYFLHGRGGDENFIELLDVKGVADSLISSSIINPLIIVCPRMENTRGLNTDSDSSVNDNLGSIVNVGRYEDYFIREVIPFAEMKYEISERFIGGASAGGYAAIHYGLKYPSLFSRIGGHMPAIEIELEESDIQYYGDEEGFHLNNPLEFNGFNQAHQFQSWYLDAGDKDEGGFNISMNMFANHLIKNDMKVVHHIFDGHHNLQYIKDNIAKYLVFYNGKR